MTDDIIIRVARAIDPEAWSFWDWGAMESQRCDETLAITDDAITAFLEAAAEPNERGVSWHMQPAGRDNRRDREEAALKFEWDK